MKTNVANPLTNIFSKEFSVETVDHVSKKLYTQTFRENMTKIEKPVIRKCTKKPYTKITWTTDFKRFGIQKFSEEMISLMA